MDMNISEPFPSAIHASKKMSKYLIVQEWLADQIKGGKIANGCKLPTEYELMQQFGVSRVTVRAAISRLKEDGFVESHQGQGSFVVRPKAEMDLHRLQGLDGVLATQGLSSTTFLVSRQREKATCEIRKIFGFPAGAEIVNISRVRYVNQTPICFEERFLPISIAEGLEGADLENADFYDLLEEKLDLTIAFGDIILDQVSASEQIAHILEIEPNSFIVETRQVNYDNGRNPIDYCIRSLIPGSFRYRMRAVRW